MIRIMSLLGVLALSGVGWADPPRPPEVVQATPVEALNATFRRTDGWVGADGAYSVPLSDRRTLWLFSDTFVGSIRSGKRTGVTMVNNTVGIQEGRGDQAKLTFAIQKDVSGKAVAILAPPDGKGWFWLMAGIPIKERLFVFLPRIEKANTPGAFGFKQVDQWLGVVENPTADPTTWKTTYAKLPFAEFAAGRAVSFGSATLTVGESVYVYGYREAAGKPFPTRRMLLARVSSRDLADFKAWRFWTGSEWGTDAKDAAPLADGLATEFSVSYVPGLKQYATVYTENGLGERVLGRFATAPEGPWSAPVVLYRCPEMKRDKGVFSYAAKAHPHLAGENELVVSYCVNAFEFAHAINDATLYWPNFVRVVLK
jgi:hypothetical protein